MDNKDYIINIRVSKDLYKKLKEKARTNGESLSNLVRKTIDDGLEILSDLRDEIFEEGAGGGKNKNASRFTHYEKVIVARELACVGCKKTIPKGETAFMGETARGGRAYFCEQCFGKR